MIEKAIGGSDRCYTCAAHVLVITEDLEPRIARLEKALLKYARHTSDCQRYGSDQCTCGFMAMIRGCSTNDASSNPKQGD